MKKKKSPVTAKALIKSSLRRIWMYSPERKVVLKRANGICERCGGEHKLEVHHKNGIPWDRIIKLIYRYLFCGPSKLEALCKVCHGNESKNRHR